MVKLLVAKILCMVGVFFFMLLGSLLPVKIIETDFEKAHRSKKILSLCNTFGGGVFLATCFNALLPAVREKLQKVLSPWAHQHRLPSGRDHHAAGLLHDRLPGAARPDLPQGEAGLYRPGDFNASSDVGSDSEYESPSWVALGAHPLYGEPHAHSHGLSVQELSALQPVAAPQPGRRPVGPLVFEGPGPGPAGGGGEGGQPVCGGGHPRDAGGRGPGHQHGQERHGPEGRCQAGRHRERHDPPGHQPRPGHRECPGRAQQRGLRAAAGPGRRLLSSSSLS
uniref:Zinc transporter ZIP3 n=1 Tax=Balaenoptera musculus TaxID=9771 RepID=A0A8C0D063_BALMU